MALTLGGVHKIQILIRDLLKEILQKIFGEEMGGVRGTQTPLLQNHMGHFAPQLAPKRANRKFPGPGGGLPLYPPALRSRFLSRVFYMAFSNIRKTMETM